MSPTQAMQQNLTLCESIGNYSPIATAIQLEIVSMEETPFTSAFLLTVTNKQSHMQVSVSPRAPDGAVYNHR